MGALICEHCEKVLACFCGETAPTGDEIRALRKAVTHVLDRSQVDPDLAWVLGPMTESFDLLCRAEALVNGEAFEAVVERRSKDLQPAHRRRRAEVQELRARLDAWSNHMEAVSR